MEETANDEAVRLRHHHDLVKYLGRRFDRVQQFRFFRMNTGCPREWDDGYFMRDPAQEPAKVRFGQLMLQDLLALPVVRESERQRLLEGLGRAMEARNTWATTCLWDKIATDAFKVSLVSNDKWDIYACDAKWPPVSRNLVAFLTLHVRRPRLLLAVMEPRMTDGENGATIRQADQTKMKPEEFGKLRKAVPAILAAVLAEFYFLSRHGVSYDDDVIHNEKLWLALAKDSEAEDRGTPTAKVHDAWSGGWARVVELLCRLMLSKPHDTNLTKVQFAYREAYGETRFFDVSLLDVAVLCSERLANPVLQLLNKVTFGYKQLLSAFEYALYPGRLRGPTMNQVALALYAKMLGPETHLAQLSPLYSFVPNLTSRMGEEQLSHALKNAWRAVYRAASWWTQIEVHGLSQQTVRLPVESGREALSPIVYESLMRALFDSHTERSLLIHDTHVWNAWQETLWLALTPCRSPEIVCKPNLVRLLVQFLHAHDALHDTVLSERDPRPSNPHTCCSILDAAALLPPTDYAFLLGLLEPQMHQVEHYWSMGFAALVEMLTKHVHPSRDNLELLFELLEKHPDKLRTALAGTSTLAGGALGCYIRRFCFPNPGSQTIAYMADLPIEARALATTKSKEHLERFLNAGQWTVAHLRTALESASIVMSGMAVQVLVSPPWNTPVPEEDAFVRAIFDAVYAPGEPVMQLASQGWGKRQRDE